MATVLGGATFVDIRCRSTFIAAQTDLPPNLLPALLVRPPGAPILDTAALRRSSVLQTEIPPNLLTTLPPAPATVINFGATTFVFLRERQRLAYGDIPANALPLQPVIGPFATAVLGAAGRNPRAPSILDPPNLLVLVPHALPFVPTPDFFDLPKVRNRGDLDIFPNVAHNLPPPPLPVGAGQFGEIYLPRRQPIILDPPNLLLYLVQLPVLIPVSVAIQQAIEEGLFPWVVWQESNTIPYGYVISQTEGNFWSSTGPDGTPFGQGIEIVASSGLINVPSFTLTIPNLVGLQVYDAVQAITKVNMVIGQYTWAPSSQNGGTVLAQNPAAGSLAPAGTQVNLTLSLGPAP